MEMQLKELYSMAKALKESNKDIWKNKILMTMNFEAEKSWNIPLEILVLAAYACFDNRYYVPNLKVIAYGAGKMAEKYIPHMSDKIEFYEIWDAFSNKKYIQNICIVRPESRRRDYDIPLVVFIDDRVLRYNVISAYREKGYTNIFYFRDYLTILEYFDFFREVKNHITGLTKDIIEEFYQQYDMIKYSGFPILFSVLDKKFRCEKIQIKNCNYNEKILKSKLTKLLTVEKLPKGNFEYAIRHLLNTKIENKQEFMYGFEIFLRELLSNNVKTRERPMRMVNDQPYDEFAVTVAINEALIYLFGDYKKILDIIQMFRTASEESVPLMGTECYFLIRCRQYMNALKVARNMMEKEPNNLLANETFYQVACVCKDEGIHVEEPIPEYDLTERFCWSGLNFVWCGGFDSQTGLADFSPCFRPLQCAARPQGEFWAGDDWKEFRKSVIDGSFRYCQKNQCPNIVAGWLPKKSECQDEWLRKILNGDLSVIPPIEELHFSYDGHCNLKCPSCRLEIQTNTREQNEILDRLYEKNLKPYMKQAKHLTLSGCGEAMISPHSKKVLESFSREKNPELLVELRTNATTINPVSWNSLGSGKDVIRHITVSIDASTKESFEKLRFPAKWEVVLHNLRFIQSLRNLGEIDMFEFHVVIQKENVNQLCDIVKMAISYDADAVTFSRLINWRGMSEEEYHDINPFWYDHPLHEKLMQELKSIKELRDNIEKDRCDLTRKKKKIYINIHFNPDPNSSYDVVRTGRLKIR